MSSFTVKVHPRPDESAERIAMSSIPGVAMSSIPTVASSSIPCPATQGHAVEGDLSPLSGR